jgi:hypothetical protein
MADEKRRAESRRAVRGGCRRRLRGSEVMTWGYLDGRLVSVAGCCVGRLSTIVGAGPYIDYTGPAPWQTVDKDWFAAHPMRSYRLRPAMRDEAVNGCPWVAVRQVRRGLRIRDGFSPNGPFVPDDEATAKAVFDRIAAAQQGLSMEEREALARFVSSRFDDGGPA